MQLLLDTETAVDVKAKMSLNEDDFEKCESRVQSTVTNGNVANGVICDEENKTSDGNKKIEQVKRNVVKATELELQLAKPHDITDNADIETSHVNDNEVNQAADILNGKDASESNESVEKTVSENTFSNLVKKETENTYNTIMKSGANNVDTTDNNMSESVPIENEQNDIVDNSALKDSTLGSTADIRIADVNKNPITEKENTVIVNTEAESTDENMTVSSIADTTGRITMETNSTIDTEVELNGDDCVLRNITGATETEISSVNLSTNIATDEDENRSNALYTNSNEDESTILVDETDGGTTKTNPETENVSLPDEAENSEEQKEDIDRMPDIDSSIDSTNDEKKESDESNIIETSNEDVELGNISNAATNCKITEMDQNILEPPENVKLETDENDENVDLIKLNFTNESDDIMECVKEELEEGERAMTDIEMNESGNIDAKIKPDLLDVDESADNVKVELEANTEELGRSISEVNKSSSNASAVDKPISMQKDESVDLIPDSSDDVIFNLDDDKDQENEFVKSKSSPKVMEIENDKSSGSNDNIASLSHPKQSDEIIDLDENLPKDTTETEARQENITVKTAEVPMIPPVLKLSNTLDILSDEEDEPKETTENTKCISIEDDDDVMLIDEDASGNDTKTEPTKEKESQDEPKPKSPVENMQLGEENDEKKTNTTTETEAAIPEKQTIESIQAPEISEKVKELSPEREKAMPLLHEKFLKTCKKNLSEMTREELEEFCILKIVESVIDRSSLSEVKSKLKTLTQNIDEYNKKAKMLTKQNRDLQVVLKSIQEDQKKGLDSIVPLKITRSVGMQVLMTDKVVQRRKGIGLPSNAVVNKQQRNPVIQSPRPQKQQAPQIPVPRLVPANNPTLKSPTAQQPNAGKITSPLPNGVKNASPVQKGEKRTHNRIQSVTVDLTDDEPPAKVVNRAQTPAVPPVRLVPSQNLLAPPRPTVNSPRKVYIPISGPQGQNVRPGQTIMLKTVPSQGPRQRCPPPHMVRMPQNIRLQRPNQGMRHPAPLPDCMKQYQPPNWKALPPAPDLKLAKVENGIVISWKIEGYQEDSYEEIASYQLYAYQETASPPNTTLWKKIGDVKALPLPMACTLTQFMAGYKYYFAVRAVDIRSRLGPFSLPGSILLLNKM